MSRNGYSFDPAPRLEAAVRKRDGRDLPAAQVEKISDILLAIDEAANAKKLDYSQAGGCIR